MYGGCNKAKAIRGCDWGSREPQTPVCGERRGVGSRRRQSAGERRGVGSRRRPSAGGGATSATPPTDWRPWLHAYFGSHPRRFAGASRDRGNGMEPTPRSPDCAASGECVSDPPSQESVDPPDALLTQSVDSTIASPDASRRGRPALTPTVCEMRCVSALTASFRIPSVELEMVRRGPRLTERTFSTGRCTGERTLPVECPSRCRNRSVSRPDGKEIPPSVLVAAGGQG